jgi:hypothetical protein
MPFNYSLCNSLEINTLSEMGFIKNDDGSGDPRGIDYVITKSNYQIWVDPWYEVTITRLDCSVDDIKLEVKSREDLMQAIEWIEGDNPQI